MTYSCGTKEDIDKLVSKLFEGTSSGNSAKIRLLFTSAFQLDLESERPKQLLHADLQKLHLSLTILGNILSHKAHKSAAIISQTGVISDLATLCLKMKEELKEPLMKSFYQQWSEDLGIWIIPLAVKRLTNLKNAMPATQTSAVFALTH